MDIGKEKDRPSASMYTAINHKTERKKTMSEETINTAEETALAQAAPVGITTFADTLMQDVTEQGYWASFPVETMDDKKKLFAARNDNELLRDHMGEVIDLVNIVIDTQVINDVNFGPRSVACVHLIAEDGTIYQSTSTGVVNKACDLISNFGMPDTWNGPLSVVCKETTTAKGYRYKYLGLAEVLE